MLDYDDDYLDHVVMQVIFVHCSQPAVNGIKNFLTKQGKQLSRSKNEDAHVM